MLRIGILASGNLGIICLRELIKTQKINFVLTDNDSVSIIAFCFDNKIPHYAGNPRNIQIVEFINQFSTDVILSINYLFLIGYEIISHAKKYAINFHGSLLPKYRGRTPHVWAIINNESFTGITAHLISEGCDEGDIVLQEMIPIDINATGSDILNIFQYKYIQMIYNVIELIETDKLSPVPQEHNKATYFGKRGPDDGEINWNWQKERIRNWVRAIAKPYPGAFSFYEGHKIIIHQIEFSDEGFDCNDKNGTILRVGDNLLIKTPNGAVELTAIEINLHHNFTQGKVLHGRY